jgi:hypothetical protein
MRDGKDLNRLIAWSVSSASTAAVLTWWVRAMEKRAGELACAVIAVRPEFERRRA